MLLFQMLVFTIKVAKNSKFKISAQKWNEEFELPDGSYSISDIQDYFKYIFLKKTWDSSAWNKDFAFAGQLIVGNRIWVVSLPSVGVTRLLS